MKSSASDNNGQPLTPRAMEVLSAICECGALTSLQISLLCFPLRYNKGEPYRDSYCLELLKKLREAGLIEEIERYQLKSEGKKAYVYRLTGKGRQILASWRNVSLAELPCRQKDNRLSKDYIEHFTLINDFRVVLMRAVFELGNDARIMTYYDDMDLKSRHSSDKLTLTLPGGKTESNVVLVPDGYFCLRVQETQPWDYHRFIEVDRGTEIGRSNAGYNDWVRKVLKYREYAKRGGAYQTRYQTSSVAVLTITLSEERVANLKKITEEVGGKHRYWFTSIDRIFARKGEPLTKVLTEPIWEIATRNGQYPLLGAGE